MLLQLVLKRSSTSAADFHFLQLMDRLAKEGFTGVFHTLRENAAGLFGAPIEKVSPAFDQAGGDLFLAGDAKLLFLKCRWEPRHEESGDPFADPGRAAALTEMALEVGQIAPVGAADAADLDRLCQALSTILEIECNCAELKWSEPGAPKGSMAEIGGKAVERPTPADLELSAILREKALQPFLAAIQEKKSELLLDQWLAERTDAEEIEYFIDKLFEADFFDEEIVVYSQHTGQPVIRAKDRAGLEALKSAGIRDVNGDELDIENVRRLLILPKDKRPYLVKSWAARVALLDLLLKLGLPAEDIRELDSIAGLQLLAALYDGKPYLFALGKNSVEPKDFAALAATLKKLGGPTVVAVAPKDTDVDAALAAGAAACVTVAGVDEFNTTLLDYLAGQRKNLIAQAMAEFDGMLKFNVASMALDRFAPAE
jgi:hypothetical protein